MPKRITPAELKVIVDRRRQIDSAWSEQELLEAILNPPPPPPRSSHRAKLVQKHPRRKGSYLSRSQHRELARGHLPKGVDWSTVKLSRKQLALVRNIGRRTLCARQRSYELAHAS